MTLPETGDRNVASGQPSQRAGAGCEVIGLDAEILQHADKQVGEWRTVLVFFVEFQQPAMFKTAPCENNRQAGVRVRVGISHSTSEQHHCLIKQSAMLVLLLGQLRDKANKLLDLVGFESD